MPASFALPSLTPPEPGAPAMACGATLKRTLDFDPLLSPASPKRRRCAPLSAPTSAAATPSSAAAATAASFSAAAASPQKYLRMEPSPFGDVASRLTTGGSRSCGRPGGGGRGMRPRDWVSLLSDGRLAGPRPSAGPASGLSTSVPVRPSSQLFWAWCWAGGLMGPERMCWGRAPSPGTQLAALCIRVPCFFWFGAFPVASFLRRLGPSPLPSSEGA